MNLDNMSVKLFFKDPKTIDLDAFIPIFHRWIQQKEVEGILIDVVDYKHVPNGPGLMLIGHECEYSIDMASGRPGLLYHHKREMTGSLSSKLQLLLKRVFQAAQLLLDEEHFPIKLDFQTNELQWYVYDRLQAPNTEETFDVLREDFEQVSAKLLSQAEIQTTIAHTDPRSLFSLSTKCNAEPIFSNLQKRSTASQLSL